MLSGRGGEGRDLFLCLFLLCCLQRKIILIQREYFGVTQSDLLQDHLDIKLGLRGG